MSTSIEKMLSHVYEIEGLMLVTKRLGEEATPDVISNKIQRKVRELAEMCGIALAPSAGAEPVAAAPAEPESPVQDEEGLPSEDYDADETWQHDNGEEFKEVFSLDYKEPVHNQESAAKEVPVADREPDDDITVEFIEAPEPEKPAAPVTPPPFKQDIAAPVADDGTVPEPSDEPVPEPDPALVPVEDPEPDIIVEFIEAEDDSLPEQTEKFPEPPVPTEFPVIEDDAAPLRVEQKMQRQQAKDFRTAFSINDRFRFQRELFANNADAMNTAIKHIEMMNSYGNAELYFFSQLNWDRENETVQDFMNIVKNHFQK